MERGRERRKGRVVVRWRLYEPSPRCGEGQAAGVRCCSTPLAYSVALSLGLESTVTFPSPTAKDEPAAALHRNLPRHSAPCIKPVTNKDPQFNSTAADAATFVYLQQRPPMQTNYPRPQTCQCYEGSSTPAQSTPNVSPSPFQPPRLSLYTPSPSAYSPQPTPSSNSPVPPSPSHQGTSTFLSKLHLIHDVEQTFLPLKVIDIWWNVWVLLAMPAVSMSWYRVLFTFTHPSSPSPFTLQVNAFFPASILSCVWRTRSDDDPSSRAPSSPTAVLGPRVAITGVLVLGLVYLTMIVKTLMPYGRGWGGMRHAAGAAMGAGMGMRVGDVSV